MVRKPEQKKGRDSYSNVGVHPELHRMIAHEAVDARETIRERLHAILCQHYERPDLLVKADEKQLATSSH